MTVYFGFDVETYGDNNKFYSGSVVGMDTKRYFTDKDEMCVFMLSKRFRAKYHVATNLSFDFLCLFGDRLKDFQILTRGSDILKATYRNGNNCIHFIDTFNYMKWSVKALGDYVGLPKLKTPSFIGHKPSTRDEEAYLKEYNIRDSEISYRFMVELDRQFRDIGAKTKITIASTAMDLFNRKYKDGVWSQPDRKQMEFIFKSYYGGRTEAFKRGKVSDMNVYDFNSLYPSVMVKEFPLTSSQKITHDDPSKLMYEGVSDVEVTAPELHIPFLPVRTKEKLIFPTGTWRGVYTHVELRKAIELGYKVDKFRKTIYYTKTHYPFKDFVHDMYNNRMRCKNTKDKMELAYKLLMNSLYGKFAQKIEDRTDVIHVDALTEKQFLKSTNLERIGEYYYVTTPMEKIPKFINPIYPAYVTAFARIKLYDAMSEISQDVFYADTDSIFTQRELPTGEGLGELKLENKRNEGIIVRPKMYWLGKKVKCKGCAGMKEVRQFMDVLDGCPYEKMKFTKYKESIRRGMGFNTKIMSQKELGLEDSKRVWDDLFSLDEVQESRPLMMIDGMDENTYYKNMKKADIMHDRKQKSIIDEMIRSDWFDSEAVGHDITAEEFIENEKHSARHE